MQENNALAKIDLATAKVLDVLPLGYKNYGAAGNGIDANDDPKGIDIKTQPLMNPFSGSLNTIAPYIAVTAKQINSSSFSNRRAVATIVGNGFHCFRLPENPFIQKIP